MIENLKGMHETVNYKTGTNLRLYNNEQAEDYPMHWHTPIEIIMPIKNTYSVITGRHTIVMEPDDIIFICPGVIHALKAPENGYRIIFQAEITMFHSIHEFELILSIMAPFFKISKNDAPAIYQKIYDLILQINEEYNSTNILMETVIYEKLLSIFILIGRNYTHNLKHNNSEYQKHKEYTEKFISICNYINEHCTEDLSLEEISNIAGFSKYHFTRLFKQFTTTTFYKYLNQKRIEHAQKMLADPSMPITEVALSSGFQSLSSFIRMFKLLNQCTPTEYRNMFIHFTLD